MQTKNYNNFYPAKQTRIVLHFFGDFLVSVVSFLTMIVALFGDFLVSVSSFFGYDPCLFGGAENLVILGLLFGRNDNLINSF